jgi:hypothetical protein
MQSGKHSNNWLSTKWWFCNNVRYSSNLLPLTIMAFRWQVLLFCWQATLSIAARPDIPTPTNDPVSSLYTSGSYRSTKYITYLWTQCLALEYMSHTFLQTITSENFMHCEWMNCSYVLCIFILAQGWLLIPKTVNFLVSHFV